MFRDLVRGVTFNRDPRYTWSREGKSWSSAVRMELSVPVALVVMPKPVVMAITGVRSGGEPPETTSERKKTPHTTNSVHCCTVRGIAGEQAETRADRGEVLRQNLLLVIFTDRLLALYPICFP